MQSGDSPTCMSAQRHYTGRAAQGQLEEGNMGIFRFRRRIRVASGVHVNVSAKSVSTSIGPRGMQITSGTRGSRTTIGIPGTGLSYTEQEAARPVAPARTSQISVATAFIGGFLRGFFIVIGAMLLAVVAGFLGGKRR